MSESTVKDLVGVEIFTAGTHRGKTYTTADLQDIVRNFELYSSPEADKVLLRVPAVLGHDEEQDWLRRSDLPAAAWPSRVYLEGDTLLADFPRVPEKTARLIEARAYRTVSAEIYDEPPDGVPGHGRMLRRVAFLGGDIPEVKGLNALDECLVSYSERPYGRVRLLPGRAVRVGTRREPCFAVFSEVRHMGKGKGKRMAEEPPPPKHRKPGAGARVVKDAALRHQQHMQGEEGRAVRPDLQDESSTVQYPEGAWFEYDQNLKDASGQRYGPQPRRPGQRMAERRRGRRHAEPDDDFELALDPDLERDAWAAEGEEFDIDLGADGEVAQPAETVKHGRRTPGGRMAETERDFGKAQVGRQAQSYQQEHDQQRAVAKQRSDSPLPELPRVGIEVQSVPGERVRSLTKPAPPKHTVEKRRFEKGVDYGDDDFGSSPYLLKPGVAPAMPPEIRMALASASRPNVFEHPEDHAGWEAHRDATDARWHAARAQLHDWLLDQGEDALARAVTDPEHGLAVADSLMESQGINAADLHRQFGKSRAEREAEAARDAERQARRQHAGRLRQAGAQAQRGARDVDEAADPGLYGNHLGFAEGPGSRDHRGRPIGRTRPWGHMDGDHPAADFDAYDNLDANGRLVGGDGRLTDEDRSAFRHHLADGEPAPFAEGMPKAPRGAAKNEHRDSPLRRVAKFLGIAPTPNKPAYRTRVVIDQPGHPRHGQTATVSHPPSRNVRQDTRVLYGDGEPGAHLTRELIDEGHGGRYFDEPEDGYGDEDFARERREHEAERAAQGDHDARHPFGAEWAGRNRARAMSKERRDASEHEHRANTSNGDERRRHQRASQAAYDHAHIRHRQEENFAESDSRDADRREAEYLRWRRQVQAEHERRMAGERATDKPKGQRHAEPRDPRQRARAIADARRQQQRENKARRAAVPPPTEDEARGAIDDINRGERLRENGRRPKVRKHAEEATMTDEKTASADAGADREAMLKKLGDAGADTAALEGVPEAALAEMCRLLDGGKPEPEQPPPMAGEPEPAPEPMPAEMPPEVPPEEEMPGKRMSEGEGEEDEDDEEDKEDGLSPGVEELTWPEPLAGESRDKYAERACKYFDQKTYDVADLDDLDDDEDEEDEEKPDGVFAEDDDEDDELDRQIERERGRRRDQMTRDSQAAMLASNPRRMDKPRRNNGDRFNGHSEKPKAHAYSEADFARDLAAIVRDEVKRQSAAIAAGLKKQAAGVSRELRKFSEETSAAEKKRAVDAIVERLGLEGKLPPREREGFRDLLMVSDARTVVRKFSEKGQTVTKTAFDLALEQVESRPSLFSERFGQPVKVSTAEDAEVEKVEDRFDAYSERFAAIGTTKEEIVSAFKARRKADPKLTADQYLQF